jgi:predicted NACHT family NTPase
MAKRSLQLSPTGIRTAKQAFALKGWTQENLAIEVNIKTRQPIWRFFTGQPVDRYIFLELCSILDLECREVANYFPAEIADRSNDRELAIPTILEDSADIDALVKQVRSQRFDKIQDQCGILQMLDISRPINLDRVYIDLNILEEISIQQQLEIADLPNIEPNQFDRQFDKLGMGAIAQSQISGMHAVEKYLKLRVLGKPGSGKTTFLQHLAVQCNHSRFVGHMVPVFITLRNFVEASRASQEFSLLDYISQEFATSGICDRSVVETLLKAGRVLVLLDGMDEILNQDCVAVLNEIRKFSDDYYKNRFVASCRMASTKLSLRGFTDVEIAPFTQTQIAHFAQMWFSTFTKTNTEFGNTKSVQFMQKLNEPSNQQLHDLVSTPLFLHLACWIFNGQEKFPAKYSEFYKQGLDLLLGKWDEARGVRRDEVYRGFLLPQKLKLLSQVAAVTFEKGQYFFTRDEIEQHIGDYLRQLPTASVEPEEIQQQSQDILKAIESQHGLLTERSPGVFSFSYLVFQKYFTARKIVASYKLQPSSQSLEELVSHIADPQWRDVFLFTATMLSNPSALMQLMRQKIENMVEDPHIREFLNWEVNFLSSSGKLSVANSNHYPIDRDWNFSPDQEKVLQCYREANQLLRDCLDDNNNVAVAAKQEMESSRRLSPAKKQVARQLIGCK